MCACYDNEAERQHAESNIYKNRLPARGNGSRLANKNYDNYSQYSVRAANSLSPHSQTSYRNQNTYTSTKKSNRFGAHMNDNMGSMTSRYDSRANAMTQAQSQNNYGRNVPQGQYMDDESGWQYNTPNANNYDQQNCYNQGQPRLQKYGTDMPDRRQFRGKYNNFMDDSQQYMPGQSA